MADIAILVAEEYERRVKNSRKAGNVNDVLVSNFFTQNVKNIDLMMLKQHNLHEFKNKVLEPKSQIGRAASNGFFSA